MLLGVTILLSAVATVAKAYRLAEIGQKRTVVKRIESGRTIHMALFGY